MSYIANYQMSIFGEFKHITPEPALMNELLGINKELKLLPSTIAVVSLDPREPNLNFNSIKPMPRIQIIEEEQKWNLAVLPDRIDINYALTDENKAEPLDMISACALLMLNNTVDILNIPFGRMSINMSELLPIASIEETKAYYNKRVTALPFQAERDIFEWQILANSKDILSLKDGTSESINVITNQTLTKNIEDETQRRVGVSFDINTSPDNMSARFGKEHLNEFYNYAIAIINTLATQIEGAWNERN